MMLLSGCELELFHIDKEETVFPITTEQEVAMMKMGVLDLKCGSYHFTCQVNTVIVYPGLCACWYTNIWYNVFITL